MSNNPFNTQAEKWRSIALLVELISEGYQVLLNGDCPAALAEDLQGLEVLLCHLVGGSYKEMPLAVDISQTLLKSIDVLLLSARAADVTQPLKANKKIELIKVLLAVVIKGIRT
jgi:hypothetical protein